jgi:hypothetical protein
MSLPHLSYSGSCTINDVQVWCRDISVDMGSKPTFYDHSVGLVESIRGIVKPGRTIPGTRIQKKFFRYSPLLPKVSISGSLTLSNAVYLLNLARSGGALVQNGVLAGSVVRATLWDEGLTYVLNNAYISSFSFDIRAGDIASFSAEFVGTNFNRTESDVSVKAQQLDKFLTWDAVALEVTGTFGVGGASGAISPSGFKDFSSVSGFSLSVNNPIVPIYTANTPQMYPRELRIGMQDTTGNISCYGPNGFLQGEGDIALFFNKVKRYTFHVVFEPPSDKASSSSAYISTTNFVCFSDNGRPW